MPTIFNLLFPYAHWKLSGLCPQCSRWQQGAVFLFSNEYQGCTGIIRMIWNSGSLFWLFQFILINPKLNPNYHSNFQSIPRVFATSLPAAACRAILPPVDSLQALSSQMVSAPASPLLFALQLWWLSQPQNPSMPAG